MIFPYLFLSKLGRQNNVLLLETVKKIKKHSKFRIKTEREKHL